MLYIACAGLLLKVFFPQAKAKAKQALERETKTKTKTTPVTATPPKSPRSRTVSDKEEFVHVPNTRGHLPIEELMRFINDSKVEKSMSGAGSGVAGVKKKKRKP